MCSYFYVLLCWYFNFSVHRCWILVSWLLTLAMERTPPTCQWTFCKITYNHLSREDVKQHLGPGVQSVLDVYCPRDLTWWTSTSMALLINSPPNEDNFFYESISQILLAQLSQKFLACVGYWSSQCTGADGSTASCNLTQGEANGTIFIFIAANTPCLIDSVQKAHSCGFERINKFASEWELIDHYHTISYNVAESLPKLTVASLRQFKVE